MTPVSATITISSSYGTDGTTIGQDVAKRLGIEFFDRAIPVAVARELAVDTDVAIARDWRAPGRMERVLGALASVSLPFGGPEIQTEDGPDVFRRTTETVLRAIADGPGGVILGRASMVVLANRPDVLCIRLDGPLDARLAQAARLSGKSIDEVREEQRVTDAAREAYVQVFYGIGQDDAQLYHLAIDATAFGTATCVEMICTAARARLGT
jgi:cytidylate kinase